MRSRWKVSFILLEPLTWASSFFAAYYLSVVIPDVDTLFADAEDVVWKLLSHHVSHPPAGGLRVTPPRRVLNVGLGI